MDLYCIVVLLMVFLMDMNCAVITPVPTRIIEFVADVGGGPVRYTANYFRHYRRKVPNRQEMLADIYNDINLVDEHNCMARCEVFNAWPRQIGPCVAFNYCPKGGNCRVNEDPVNLHLRPESARCILLAMGLEEIEYDGSQVERNQNWEHYDLIGLAEE